MRLIDEVIEMKSRSDRFEFFPIYDCHVGKRNCDEESLKKEVREILRRSKMPGRHVRVGLGGDICDVIKPQDIRFDFNGLADWLFEGKVDDIKEKLNDIAKAQVIRAANIFKPISHLIMGGIEANHDRVVRKRYNCDTHKDFCKTLGIDDLTDETIIRFRFKNRPGNATRHASIEVYMRHGYGGGRTAGAEPNKIARMMADGVTQGCDICFTGHTHTVCYPEPIPKLIFPRTGRVPPFLITTYRHGANPGCWLLSHEVGPGTYESAACYPARALVTLKAVAWPFWHTVRRGYDFSVPKIEIRQYPIL